MVSIDDNNLIKKWDKNYLLSNNGVKVYQQKQCDSPLNNLQM